MFVAPTRPLVTQQREACRRVMGMSQVRLRQHVPRFIFIGTLPPCVCPCTCVRARPCSIPRVCHWDPGMCSWVHESHMVCVTPSACKRASRSSCSYERRPALCCAAPWCACTRRTTPWS